MAVAVTSPLAAHAADGPAMKDFMGVNGLATLLKPVQMSQAVKMVRAYHNFSWDVGNRSDNTTRFPTGHNTWPNYNVEYGSWVDQGIKINTAVQFSENQNWINIAADSYKYGRAFASFFGPTVGNGLVDSVQIGNENAFYSDSMYRTILTNMAAGVRSVDPHMKIVTANMHTGAAGTNGYANSLPTVFNGSVTQMPDAIAVHTYPHMNGWPNWDVSYPEDPRTPLLTNVQKVIDWRDANAPGVEVWITEFGYDSPTRPQDRSGDFSRWRGYVTDVQQARYLTRAWLNFAAMDVERAYMFFDNDGDSPSLHGSAGLTRDGVPKPSYWAVSHMQRTLGDYSFDEVIRKDTGAYVFSFEHESDESKLIYALWSPTGSNRVVEIELGDLPGIPYLAERSPYEGDVLSVTIPFTLLDGNRLRMTISEMPTYLFFMIPPEAVPEPASIAVMAGMGTLLLRRRRPV